MEGESGMIGEVGTTMEMKYRMTATYTTGDTSLPEGTVIEPTGLEFAPESPSGIVLIGDVVNKSYIQRVPLDVLDLSGIVEEKEFIRGFKGFPKGTRFKLDEVDLDSQPLTAFGWVIKRTRVRVCVGDLERIG